jgi:hypothetical protein
VQDLIKTRAGRRPGLRAAGFLAIIMVVEACAFPARAHDDGDRPSREEPPRAPTNANAASAPSLLDPQQASPPAKGHRSPWPFALIGVGALTLGTGAWLVHRDNQAGTPMCTAGAGGHPICPYATSTEWQGWAFVGIGAQIAIAGVIWRIVESRQAPMKVTLAAGPGAVRLVGTF